MKSRGGLGPLLLPRFYFFALLFISHRSPLSERLEQANIFFEKCIQKHIKNTLRQLRKTANTHLNTSYNSCKRTQNCWPTTPNIVRCYMFRSFAYPVACCCVLLGGCYIRLYTTNKKQLAAN